MNKELNESIGGGKTIFKQATGDEINKYELELIEAMRAIHYPGRWDTVDTVTYPRFIDALREIGCNPLDCIKGNGAVAE